MKHNLVKYTNRKLYSKDVNQYVTINDVLLMIQSGEQVTVIEHSTGRDVTPLILKRAFLKAACGMSSAYLHKLIQTEGRLLLEELK